MLAAEVAALFVVGGDEADEVFALEVRINNDRWDSGSLRVGDGGAQRRVIEWRQHNAIDAPRNHILDDLDLLLAVVFLERPFPENVDIQFFGGLEGAGVDGFPEFMRRALGNHGNREAFVFAVDRRHDEKDSGEQDQDVFAHDDSSFHHR